jgi:kinetochore protein NDC80
MHDKAYLKEQINHIILYCTAHHYDRPLSPKLLLSPSAKDFRHLMLFLLQQVDPNFAFTANVEEDIKRYMKLLGYPFNISKNALQAAGTPHTWPALLLMMSWIVDFLNVSSSFHSRHIAPYRASARCELR